jgi:fructose-bisphosphate aldolase class II
LVTHAHKHGYLVVSFKVFSSETIQAVVDAAERDRAPVILAIEVPSTTFIDHRLTIATAESAAERALVPIAIELLCGGDGWDETVPSGRFSSLSFYPHRAGDSEDAMRRMRCVLANKQLRGKTIEGWLPIGAVDIAESPYAAAVDFVGVDLRSDNTRNSVGAATLRRYIAALTASRSQPLVVCADSNCLEKLARSLPLLGVAKVNVSDGLTNVVATQPHRHRNTHSENFWDSAERMFGALVDYVSRELRRWNSSGRAADVLLNCHLLRVGTDGARADTMRTAKSPSHALTHAASSASYAVGAIAPTHPPGKRSFAYGTPIG